MGTRLDDEEWLPQAQQLAVGRSIRIQHVACSRRDNLQITNAEDCYKAMCYSCGGWGKKPKTHMYSAPKPKADTKTLPDDLVPLGSITNTRDKFRVLQALAQKGIDISMLHGWNPSYSNKAQRIVIQGDGAILGRTIGTSHAKWLTYSSYGYCKSTIKDWNRYVILTEDVLSAAKVQWALKNEQVTVVSMLGTKLHKHLLVKLLDAENIFFMLDPDVAGLHGRSQGIKQLSALDIPWGYLDNYDVDPKLLSSTQINEIWSKRND